MSAARLLADLAREGVSVSLADAEHLAVEGPRDRCDEVLARVVAHKAELLAFLKKAEPDALQAREAKRNLDPMPWADGMRAPDLTEFAERAAWLEYGEGLTRERAEHAAAQALGFADPDVMARAALAAWRSFAASMPTPTLDAAQWRHLQSLALAFLAEGNVLGAIRAGWTGEGLFGVDPALPMRADRWGAVFRPDAGHVLAREPPGAFGADGQVCLWFACTYPLKRNKLS